MENKAVRYKKGGVREGKKDELSNQIKNGYNTLGLELVE